MTERVRAAESPQKAPGRIAWADTARGIAISLVATYHATNWLLAATLPVEYWTQINLVLATLRMPLFFVVSGLFAGKWLTASWSDLWHKKVLLFVWVFLVWEVIGTFTLQLGLIMEDKCCSSVGSNLKSILISPIAPRFELWFIWALAIFFVAAKLIHRVDYRIQLAVAGVAAAIAMSGWTTDNVGWSGSVKYFFFFLVGIYAREVVFRIGAIRSRWALGGMVAGWAVISFGIWFFNLTNVPGVYFVNALIGVVAGVAASRLLARVRVLGWIGTQTLPVYLAHTPIILVLAFILWQPAILPHVLPLSPVVPPLVAAIAITLALLLHRVLARTPLRVVYEPPRFLSRQRQPKRPPQPEVTDDSTPAPRADSPH